MTSALPFTVQRVIHCALDKTFVFNTSVPDVLPSEQCLKRCTAKDKADVTGYCQQMVASCENIINRLYIEDCKFFGCD